MTAVTRAQLLATLRGALEALPAVHAAWEGGSAAFGREDEWSDVDAVAVVADDAVLDVFAAFEAALDALSPRELTHEVSGTAGYAQRFYRLRDAGEFLVVDLVLLRRSDPLLFREVEIHGQGHTWLDRFGLLQAVHHLDLAADLAAAQARIAPLGSAFSMFQHLVKKDLARGRSADAIAFFQAYTWRPLIEALRLLHAPHTRVFGPRYLQRDLPAATADAAAALAYAASPAALSAHQAQAAAWFEAAHRRLREHGPGAGLGEAALPPG
jgi:predicted nucleotidyltransferase